MAGRKDDRPVPGYPDSLGPDLHTGGNQEPGGLVPPYEGRNEADGESARNQPYATKEQPYAGREISETEREGVPSTDTSGRSPLGVGVSHTPQGNEAALGSSEEQRRKDREEAGINPGKPVDPSMPNLRPGDQAG